jgi:hypothetical protein
LTKADLERSTGLFERALEEDALYGPAWGCMAAAHTTLYEWFGAGEDDLAKAEKASQKASNPFVIRGWGSATFHQVCCPRPETILS